MKEHNKNKAKVPNLRFPGFQGEWETKKLGEIMKIGSGKDYKHLSEGDIPVFGTGGCMTFVNEYLMDGESVFIGRKGTINKPSYYSGKFWTVDTLFYTHSFDKIIPKFAFYCFEKINWLKYNEASGVPSLSKSTIEQIEIQIPAIDEQVAITDLLTLIDDRINRSIKIIQNLESKIRIIREKLFKQHIRFKDETGNDYPDWEVKKLGEVLSFGSGRDYKHLGNGNFPVFGTGGLMTYVDSFLYDGETVCIGRKGTIDKPMYYNGKIWTVDTLFYTHSFIDIVPKYAFYVFQSINWKEYNEASGVPSLSKSTIEKIEVLFPKQMEQHKIAHFLSSIDDKIETEKKILEQYKNQKAYLLQNLFI